MPAVVDKILRAGEGKQLRKLKKIADQVNAIEDDFVDMSDAELRELTDEFRLRIARKLEGKSDKESDKSDKDSDEGDDEEADDDLEVPDYTERIARALEGMSEKEADDALKSALDEILPEAFATAREAAKRTLGQRHFDVQVMGGAALHFGNIAEMRTGEGKTLTAVLPSYLNALAGRGVHIVTVNDYLAKRDAEWMGRIHQFLGLEVGVILAQMTPDERKKAYDADITYGTNNEFGFDYLRDNMAASVEECVQRGHAYSIVDEVDSILIDEARTPLIISGPAEQSARWYTEFARISPKLVRSTDDPDDTTIEKTGDYEVDEKKKTIGILEAGVGRVENELGIDNLYDPINTPLVSYLNNAIKAKELYKKDKDYIVSGGEVLIVDEFTGRILHGRRYNEGMHQAIEAKEGVPIKDENQTLATITLQNYFRLYGKLSGMTGTAVTEAAEFNKIYKLGVLPIPTNMPMIRDDQVDLIYKTEQAKFEAVVEDIGEKNEEGQPVLVGTTSVEKSERLSRMLKRRGIKHEVLNAKNHAREAAIIAEAGRKGGVTVATNMAGRGTDIMLGGNPDHMADVELHARGLSPLEAREEYEKAWPEALEKSKKAVEKEHEEVVELGGLYVLGTERHESRRIDNQLRGRSGRQGDPGASRFYLSLEDDLMRLFNSPRVGAIMNRLNIPDDVPIEHKIVSNAIRSAQGQIEQRHFESRKNILKYDEVMDRQRKKIYEERRKVLEGEDLRDQVRKMIDEVIEGYVNGATSEGYAEEWDLDKLWKAFTGLYPISVTADEVLEAAGAGEADDDGERDLSGLTAELITEHVQTDAQEAYDKREEHIGEGPMREFERAVVLQVLDRKWREHLYEMDYLQEGIGLRAMAQRDPLVEYQREGYDMFNTMLEAVKEESVVYLFNVEVEVIEEHTTAQADDVDTVDTEDEVDEPHIVAKGLPKAKKPDHLDYSAPTLDTADGVEHHSEGAVDGKDEKAKKVSRNDPCPCGSGKKYKRCHGDPRNTDS